MKTRLHPQRGMTLMELLVGMAVGLLIVATAMGALMVSRGISGSVSDASDLQQQGAHAMRIMGQQIRQAGSLRLHLFAPNAPENRTSPVLMEAQGAAAAAWNPLTDTIGIRHDGLLIGFAADHSQTTTNEALTVNCLGQSGTGATRSLFRLKDHELQCSNGDDHFQTLIQHVAHFDVRYLLQDKHPSGQPRIAYVEADAVQAAVNALPHAWGSVQAVEVCLELFGQEAISVPEDSSYQGCRGPVAYSNLPPPRQQRMHLTMRSIFQLRSQGAALSRL